MLFLYLFYILFPLVSTLVFVHCHYKKYNLFTSLNDYLLFKKMLFNKKINYQPSNKSIISHTFFFLFFLYLSLLTFFNIALEIVEDDGIVFTFLFLVMVFIGLFILPVLIIRVIYEFIVLPYCHSLLIQQYYAQNMNMQPNMQNNQVIQNPVSSTTEVPLSTPTYNQTNIPIHNGQQYKFCSQCGTKYDISATNCPNCGES